MSIETLIKAMPKVDLHLQFEGTVPRETIMIMVDQNEVKEKIKRFDKWLETYQNPDFKKLDDLTEMLRSWIEHEDDLVRAVYDIGVWMNKDNIRYAEIAINPLAFVTGDFTFDQFIASINDGRDRAERAWGVKMRWVLLTARNDPRRADEIGRWAASTTARKGGVVGIAVAGHDGNAPLDAFERAFSNAEKKGLSRTVYLNEKDDLTEAIKLLNPTAIVDAWGAVHAAGGLGLAPLVAANIELSIGLKRAERRGWVSQMANYPLAQMIAAGVPLTFTTHMPTLFGATLSEDFTAAVALGLMTLEDVQTVTLRSLQRAQLTEEEKAELTVIFNTEIAVLLEEHAVN